MSESFASEENTNYPGIEFNCDQQAVCFASGLRCWVIEWLEISTKLDVY